MKDLNEVYRQVKIKEFIGSLNEEQTVEYLYSLNENSLRYIFQHNLVEAKARFNPEILKLKAGVGVDLTPAEKAALEGLNQSVPSRPAADLKASDLRAKYAKGPKEDPTIAGKSQPAADLKPGDMRSQFAKGPPTDAGVAKADATFKDTSSQIGARRAAEKASAETDMRTQARTDAEASAKAQQATGERTAARTDAEAKAKREVTMNDTVKKVTKGLAGTVALGAGAYVGYKLGQNVGGQNPAQAGSELKPATIMPDKPEFKFGSKKGGVVPAAELSKYREHVGNKNVTLGQYMNARDKLTAVPGRANDPQQIMKSKNIGAADVYRPEQIKAGKAQRGRPAVTESLIDAFLKIQKENFGNLFEAAKKAKKDWDKDGKIKSEKDEVWGSRFRAAGIQKEESEAEKAKKNPMSHERDAASSRIPNRELTTDEMPKKKASKVVQTGKNTSTAYKAEEVEFSDAELAHLSSIDEANPIAPVPDDYSGAAGGVSKRDLSDETVAEGIRGMRRKDTKFKDDPKKYSNEYPKSYREPGTMSKSEMRDHIEASVRKYLKAGGKIKKN